MGYLFKKIESQDKTVFELRTKNFCVFTALVFLLGVPTAVFLAINYFENVNILRVYIVIFMLIVYAILDGKAIVKIMFSKHRIREGSMFSFKNQLKYIIKTK